MLLVIFSNVIFQFFWKWKEVIRILFIFFFVVWVNQPFNLLLYLCNCLFLSHSHPPSESALISYSTWSQGLSARNTWHLLLMSSLGPYGDVEVSRRMIKGLWLNTTIVLFKLAGQTRLLCFWRKPVFGDLAVVPCAVPRVWVSVGGKWKMGTIWEVKQNTVWEEIREYTETLHIML